MKHTLLLVDDDIPFSMVVKNSLEKDGYNVLSAQDTAHAKKILHNSSSKIEVMLLDWSLPGHSGIDFLKEIKKEKSFEDLQVILQTVLNSSENIREGIDAGAFFYLVKPVKKNLLQSTIRAAIRNYERKQDLLKKLEESKHSFRYLTEGTFHFRTVTEGDFLAVRIAHECPNPQDAILVSELFSNAVEHGNAGLSYDEKTKLIVENKLNQEVERRLALPQNQHKFVHVYFRRLPDRILLRVEDEGRGFDFEKYLQLDQSRVLHNHGRGIALLNSYYRLQYLGNGNQVVVELPTSQPKHYN